jgi:hypothetical protein
MNVHLIAEGFRFLLRKTAKNSLHMRLIQMEQSMVFLHGKGHKYREHCYIIIQVVSLLPRLVFFVKSKIGLMKTPV